MLPKFALRGVFALGDINQQLGALRLAWPSAREEAGLDDHGFWFLSDAPFGLVWNSSERGVRT